MQTNGERVCVCVCLCVCVCVGGGGGVIKQTKQMECGERDSCTQKYRFCYIIIIDRFYIALFSALEQTHCTRM